MKTNYTDEQLQAAIDEACLEIHRNHRVKVGSTLIIAPNALSSAYAAEESVRLDLIKSALAALPEPMDEESMLLNLLAVIHRDGGHYQAEHGTRKAVEDACKEWQRLISIVEKTWLTEPEPETFEAHGKTWTKHTPGDAMPCDGSSAVMALLGDGTYGTQLAEDWVWNTCNSKFDIIGWRYADEPTPEPLVTKPISLPTPNEAIYLRDWFAGQALEGMLSNPESISNKTSVAMHAYGFADAMLAAREVAP